MCFKTFNSTDDAYRALNAARIAMPVRMQAVMGNEVKPIVICDFEADYNQIKAMGFDAQMVADYADE